MKPNVFETEIEFWKERLRQEKECSPESDNYDEYKKLGYLLSQRFSIEKQITERERKIAYNIWEWWFRYNLAKRTMKKFDVKNIYKSKKASDYWAKYYKGTLFKGKKPIISFSFDNSTKRMLIGLLENMLMNDLDNKEHYLYIIDKLGV